MFSAPPEEQDAHKVRHVPTMKKIGDVPQRYIVDNKIADMAEGS